MSEVPFKITTGPDVWPARAEVQVFGRKLPGVMHVEYEVKQDAEKGVSTRITLVLAGVAVDQVLTAIGKPVRVVHTADGKPHELPV